MGAVLGDVANAAEKLALHLVGAVFGRIAVKAVDTRITQAADDEDAVFFHLTLSDPAGETWPKEDVLKLRREVVRMATDAEIDLPIYLLLTAESDQPQQDDEPEQAPALF